MTAVRTRALELMSTVTFHEITADMIESFALKLAEAVRAVVREYPAVSEFLIEPDLTTGDINYGLRFASVDPAFVDEMAGEILEKAVEIIAASEGAEPVNAEREESVLVLNR